MTPSPHESSIHTDFRKALGEKLVAQRKQPSEVASSDAPRGWIANKTAVLRIEQILKKAESAVQAELCLPVESALSRPVGLNFPATMEKYIFAIAAELEEYCLGNGRQFIDVWKSMLSDVDLQNAIQIQIDSDQVVIRLPFMFLQYGRSQDPLAKLLAAKISTCPDFPQWTHWHASFIHRHSLTGAWKARDVDNYSYKKIIDVIALAMNTSDNPSRFDMDLSSYFTDDYIPACFIVISPKNSDFTTVAPPRIGRAHV